MCASICCQSTVIFSVILPVMQQTTSNLALKIRVSLLQDMPYPGKFSEPVTKKFKVDFSENICETSLVSNTRSWASLLVSSNTT